jgi:hypothetical protein
MRTQVGDVSRIANIVLLATMTPTLERAATCTDGTEVAFALRDEHTGLHWYLERTGAPIDLGWGYDGAETCVVGRRARRTAVVFPFDDPYGGTPKLTIAIVEANRVVAKADPIKVNCWDLAPVEIRATRTGWRLGYRCGDGPIETVALDRDGERILGK